MSKADPDRGLTFSQEHLEKWRAAAEKAAKPLEEWLAGLADEAADRAFGVLAAGTVKVDAKTLPDVIYALSVAREEESDVSTAVLIRQVENKLNRRSLLVPSDIKIIRSSQWTKILKDRGSAPK